MRASPVTWLFGLLCVGGTVAALALTVHEARRDAPVQANVVTSIREGLTTVAEVDLRSSSSAARCVLVRVVAQDREGRDLGASDPHRLDLAARQQTRLTARLQLTARQYAERLTGLRVTVDAC